MAVANQMVFVNRARLKVLVALILEAMDESGATVQLHDERGRFAEGTAFQIPPRGTPFYFCQDLGANESLQSPTQNVMVSVVSVGQVMKA